MNGNPGGVGAGREHSEIIITTTFDHEFSCTWYFNAFSLVVRLI